MFLCAVDSILTHLETLKHEAAEVAKKVEETDEVMAEVETTSQQYVPLAQSCSSIYFTLEAMQQVRQASILWLAMASRVLARAVTLSISCIQSAGKNTCAIYVIHPRCWKEQPHSPCHASVCLELSEQVFLTTLCTAGA